MNSLDPSGNVEKLFRSVQAGKYAIVKTSTDLAAAVLESSGVSVGKDKSSFPLVDKDLNTVDVCTVFCHYVKFTVTPNSGVYCILRICQSILEFCAFWNNYCVRCCKGAIKISFLCLSNNSYAIMNNVKWSSARTQYLQQLDDKP